MHDRTKVRADMRAIVKGLASTDEDVSASAREKLLVIGLYCFPASLGEIVHCLGIDATRDALKEVIKEIIRATAGRNDSIIRYCGGALNDENEEIRKAGADILVWACEYSNYSSRCLVGTLKNKDVRTREIVKSALSRIANDPRLFVSVVYPLARSLADGEELEFKKDLLLKIGNMDVNLSTVPKEQHVKLAKTIAAGIAEGCIAVLNSPNPNVMDAAEEVLTGINNSAIAAVCFVSLVDSSRAERLCRVLRKLDPEFVLKQGVGNFNRLRPIAQERAATVFHEIAERDIGQKNFLIWFLIKNLAYNSNFKTIEKWPTGGLLLEFDHVLVVKQLVLSIDGKRKDKSGEREVVIKMQQLAAFLSKFTDIDSDAVRTAFIDFAAKKEYEPVLRMLSANKETAAGKIACDVLAEIDARTVARVGRFFSRIGGAIALPLRRISRRETQDTKPTTVRL